MLNHEIVTETVKSSRLVSITCDKCGKTFENKEEIPDIFEIQEFFHIKNRGGYGSVFGDGDLLSIDLCQHCMKEILEREFVDLDKFITELD
jgi:hypothetical protein